MTQKVLSSLSDLDALRRTGLRITQKTFDVSPDENRELHAINVEGRVVIDDEAPSVLVTLKFTHATKTVHGTLTGELFYGWDDQVSASFDELADFARNRAVIAAFNAVAALFVTEFQQYGVRMAFPPPDLPYNVADILVEALDEDETDEGS
ncbi:hypothetical protein SEA_BEEGEE_45 [Gordonia phage BeeGee]|nr:hypothetical protein SEA_BEEGEE_45 [Gordonia phage BeeGee]